MEVNHITLSTRHQLQLLRLLGSFIAGQARRQFWKVHGMLQCFGHLQAQGRFARQHRPAFDSADPVENLLQMVCMATCK